MKQIWISQIVLFLKNSIRNDKRNVIEIIGFKKMESTIVYLGNSLVLGRNKTKEFANMVEQTTFIQCRESHAY